MNPSTRLGADLRSLLDRPDAFLTALGAANAMAARVAADADFDALWVSGLEVSALLGLPDTNVLGSRDLCETVTAVRRSCTLPVIVDIDNAGASIDNARRLAFDLRNAGAAAVCIEDSAFPKCNSFRLDRDQQLADPALVAVQLEHLRECGGPELVIIARTEALIAGEDLDVALSRAESYVAAGADAVLIHTRDTSGEQARLTAHRWQLPIPLVTVPTSFPQVHRTQLAGWGFRLAIYANQLTRASLAAMRHATLDFAQAGTFDPARGRLSTVEDLLCLAEPAAVAKI
jgi:phosphoenolpyruvate phosphomutase